MHCTAPPERYICFVLQFEGSAVGRQSCVQAYACMYVHGNSSLTMSGPCTCTQQLTQHVQGMHTSADSVCARFSVCIQCVQGMYKPCAPVCKGMLCMACVDVHIFMCKACTFEGNRHARHHASVYIHRRGSYQDKDIHCMLFSSVFGRMGLWYKLSRCRL
jgi:hypothetical protein